MLRAAEADAPTSYDTRALQHGLALLLQAQGAYDEAGALYRRALAGFEQALAGATTRTRCSWSSTSAACTRREAPRPTLSRFYGGP